jgi:aspartate aminotransferase
MTPALSARILSIAPSATLAVTDRARELREAGADVISFGAGEPDFPTPPHVCEAAQRAIRDGDTKYPSPVAGKTPLRQAVCEYLKTYCGIEVRPSQVCISMGVKDALYLAFACLLNLGDEVIIPAPYWVSYPDQVRLCDGVPVIVRGTRRDSLKVAAAEIAAAITPRTRMLVLNSPSNPSGEVYSREELSAIADVLRGTNVVVISDEIYHRLVFTDSPATCFASLPGMLERTITVNGVSKTYAMTGWRLGYAAGPEWIISAMVKMIGQTTSGAVSFVQTAAVEALRGPQDDVEVMRQAYIRRAERMWRRLSAIPDVTCPRPQGAFFCLPDVSRVLARLGLRNSDEFAARLLEEQHVALVAGGPFGVPDHVRLSFATSDAAIDAGLTRIERFLAR